MGGKWDQIPIFQNSIRPIFRGLPQSALCKHQVTALNGGKMANFSTLQYSPPQRLLQTGLNVKASALLEAMGFVH